MDSLFPLSFMVTGTGTDVGKTIALSALLRSFLLQKKRVCAVKIIQTGVEKSHLTEDYAGDYPWYRDATKDLVEDCAKVLHVFPLAASPHLACAECATTLSVKTLAQEIRALQKEAIGLYDVLLFETAGGLRVPLNAQEDMLMLMQELGFPVILVSANELGALNHTFLSLDALHTAALPLHALILSQKNRPKTPSELRIQEDTQSFIQKRLTSTDPTAFFCELPFLAPFSQESWNKAAHLLTPLTACTKREPAAYTPYSEAELLQDDKVLWHPYSSVTSPGPCFGVAKTHANRITLKNGQELIDGMSSWWSAIHGYNNPHLQQALFAQGSQFSHIMFGGFTHEPAVRLGNRLLNLFPNKLTRLFFADSGSVAVEVALKMALQYQAGKGRTKRTLFLTPRGGYHGDTFGAMSVCDPVTGMHTLFADRLMHNIFMERPSSRFDKAFDPTSLSKARTIFAEQGEHIAAVILEPVVQGAGGMWFYHPDYLNGLATLCKEHDALLIYDEIATGFGHTGKLFAQEWTQTSADILCLGKALTGGMMTLAATLCSEEVAEGICAKGGVFMHGPTFMANPLACQVANASLDLIASGAWQSQVAGIEACMKDELEAAKDLPGVSDVRVLGDIGVIEMQKAVDVSFLTRYFVAHGVWIRPFNNLIYIMPPYISPLEDVTILCRTMKDALLEHNAHLG